jgi:hypothetical protein
MARLNNQIMKEEVFPQNLTPVFFWFFLWVQTIVYKPPPQSSPIGGGYHSHGRLMTLAGERRSTAPQSFQAQEFSWTGEVYETETDDGYNVSQHNVTWNVVWNVSNSYYGYCIIVMLVELVTSI